MKKRIFRYKWLFLLSVLFHSGISLIYIFVLLNFRKEGFTLWNFLQIFLFLILNILIIISLFEKFRKTVLLINITLLPLFLWSFSMVCWNMFFGIFSDQSLKKAIFIGLYLIIINIFKYKEVYNDLDEIGKPE